VGSLEAVTNHRQTGAKHAVILKASMKDAAIPLMDAGKALARSGELWIEWTALPEQDLYGGSISSAGASIRNAGDCVAQAAASCRFKTGLELVCDELRESGTCLAEAGTQMISAFNSKGSEQENVPPISTFVGAFTHVTILTVLLRFEFLCSHVQIHMEISLCYAFIILSNVRCG
jgi:hypothetical protein